MLGGRMKGIVRKRNSSRFFCTVASVIDMDSSIKNTNQLIKRGKVKKDRKVDEFIGQISRELIVNFDKTSTQAQTLINKAGLHDYFVKHPIALHDSPHEWAIKILTKNNDFKTLEQYYSS